MEEYRNCPICFEVPEKEIYQCSAGHIICNVCIAKLKDCPQCRVNYGAKRVRSRVLEAVLDNQTFECKFIDKGCAHLCKRSEISSHANSCEFNPDSIPLCELLGWDDCKFKFGIHSRGEIFSHFKTTHAYHYEPKGYFDVDTRSTKTWILENTTEPINHWAVLCSLDNEKNSPLFIVVLRCNNPTGFMSLTCVQLWGSNNSEKYKVEFSLRRGDPTPAAGDSKHTLSTNSVKIDPFLLNWTMNAYTVKEAEHMLTKYPINLHLPALDCCNANYETADLLHVKIALIS